jgi:hypothetical protein
METNKHMGLHYDFQVKAYQFNLRHDTLKMGKEEIALHIITRTTLTIAISHPSSSEEEQSKIEQRKKMRRLAWTCWSWSVWGTLVLLASRCRPHPPPRVIARPAATTTKSRSRPSRAALL